MKLLSRGLVLALCLAGGGLLLGTLLAQQPTPDDKKPDQKPNQPASKDPAPGTPTITEIRLPAGGEDDQRDAAFERYADPKALGEAWERRDAGALADAVLQFVEGERILGRSHQTLGVTAAKLLDLSVRLAADTRDAGTLERLAKIAGQRQDTDLADRIKAARQLLAAPRAVNAALEKLLAGSLAAQEIYQDAQAARLAGNRKQLEVLAAHVASMPELKEEQAALLKKELTTMAEALPAPGKQVDVPLDDVLARLGGSSRNPRTPIGAWKRIEVPFDYRGVDPPTRFMRVPLETSPPAPGWVLYSFDWEDRIRTGGARGPLELSRATDADYRTWIDRCKNRYEHMAKVARDAGRPDLEARIRSEHQQILNNLAGRYGLGKVHFEFTLQGAGARAAGKLICNWVYLPIDEASLLSTGLYWASQSGNKRHQIKIVNASPLTVDLNLRVVPGTGVTFIHLPSRGQMTKSVWTFSDASPFQISFDNRNWTPLRTVPGVVTVHQIALNMQLRRVPDARR